MYRIIDSHEKALNKDDIDNLFHEFNKSLRKKMKKYTKDFKATLYIVGGAWL